MKIQARLFALIPLTVMSIAACGSTAPKTSSTSPVAPSTSEPLPAATIPIAPAATTAPTSPTVAATALPTTTSLPAGWGSAALDVSAQTAFGFGVGAVSSEKLLRDVSAQMGPVTNDTGWYTLPSQAPDNTSTDCLADKASRILRWGDLSFAFWQQVQIDPSTPAGEFLWSWSVGDPRVSTNGDRREPNIPATPAATGLRTVQGIGVGSTLDAVTEAYGQQFHFTPMVETGEIGTLLAMGEFDQSSGSSASLIAHDGTITGLGSTRAFC